MEVLDPNGPQYQRPVRFQQSQDGFLSTLVIKISGGKISTSEQAQKVLIFVLTFFILATLYMIVIRPKLRPIPEGARGIQSHDVSLPTQNTQ